VTIIILVFMSMTTDYIILAGTVLGIIVAIITVYEKTIANRKSKKNITEMKKITKSGNSDTLNFFGLKFNLVCVFWGTRDGRLEGLLEGLKQVIRRERAH